MIGQTHIKQRKLHTIVSAFYWGKCAEKHDLACNGSLGGDICGAKPPAQMSSSCCKPYKDMQ